MAKDIPSVGQLFRAGAVTRDEIDAAADAYLADPKAGRFAFKSGHSIDIPEAIKQHPTAAGHLADEKASPVFRRNMVRTAVLMGFPVEG